MKLDEKFEYVNDIPFVEVKTSWDDPRVFRLKIDSLEENLDSYKKYFSDEDWKSLFTEKMTEKRKKEHLAGRLIAKSAISWKDRTENGNVVSLSDINIITVKNGKPYGQLNNNKYNLSISHSHDWAIASISKEQHGIDIELSEKRDQAFQKEAFTQEEIKKIIKSTKELKLTEEQVITMVFSAKEALLKKIGVGLKGGLKKVKLIEIKEITHKRKDKINYFELELMFESKSYGIFALILGDYVITTTK
jgi:phosphopantetheinyl transferase